MFYVYIIYTKCGNTYYVGHTSDLERRLKEHNAGVSAYTSRFCDWSLKYTQAYTTRNEAQKMEAAIKKKKSRKYIEWLISQP